VHTNGLHHLKFKKELDGIFSDPTAQEIIKQEQTMLRTTRHLIAQANRIGELRNIVPKPQIATVEHSTKNALLNFLRHPLKKPL